ncbi:unnamed protein product [Thelazia callipaeda]|uniref:Acyl-CoA dehydrogenase family member 9, mitochondrial n=1 Tax=Thelazia callipaeda TaxID=103827 RepID=A0A0N5CV72_THECL|nr:unnamed protein product [Thelazia callipaeda]
MRCALKSVFLLSCFKNKTRIVSLRCCQSVTAKNSKSITVDKMNELSAYEIVKEYDVPIQRVSLSRGLALNRFEKDFFIYPEYSDTETVRSLLQLTASLKKDIEKMEAQGKFVEALWDEYKLFSYTVPKKYGGIDACYKDLLTICEGLGSSLALYTRFEQTYLASSLILKYGSEKQKLYYLTRIASGAIQPAVCFPMFQTYVLNQVIYSNFQPTGYTSENIDNKTKLSASYLVNGSNPNFFLVFPQIDEDITCYLVPQSEQLTKENAEIRIFDKCDIRVNWLDLNHTLMNSNIILGRPEDGKRIALEASMKKIIFGAAVVGFMKTLINNLSNYCNAVLTENTRLAEKDAVKASMTKLALNTYVLESMCYYVAGFYDEELIVLLDVEEAIIHRYARRVLSEAITLTVNVLGISTIKCDLKFDRLLSNMMAALLLSSTEVDLENFAASKVITSYANTKAVHIDFCVHEGSFRQWRSLNKRFYDRIFGQVEKAVSFCDPNPRHFVAEHVHPSLKEACINLEHTMCRLDSLLDLLLSKHGKSIIFDCSVHKAISNVLECNLGMVATIARSSRSYSIGLKNGDLEVSWTHLYCSEAANASMADLRKLYYYFRFERLNALHCKIGQSVLDADGYCIESPITRNW